VIPICFHTKGADIWPHGPYAFFVTPDGVYLVKDNPVFRAVIRLNNEELGLEPLGERIELKAEIKVEYKELRRAVEFFRHVYREYKREAFLWIVLEMATGVVTFFSPKQQNYAAHVRAEDDPDFDHSRFLKIGTMHSHLCKPFHSSGDKDDEATSDGLHVVCGSLENSTPEFSATLVVKGRRKAIDAGQILDWECDFDPKWLEKIHVR
jgi:hypothetical protein